MASFGRVTYAFAGDEGIILEEGDVFVIIANDDGSGWTKVKDKHSTIGFAPTNYFDPISEREYNASSGGAAVVQPVYVEHHANRSESQIDDADDDSLYAEVNYSEVNRNATTEQVEVLYDYTAKDGSITVTAGEVLDLMDKSNSEWWKIKTKSGGMMGFVPHNYVTLQEAAYETVARPSVTAALVIPKPSPLYQPKTSLSSPKAPGSSGNSGTTSCPSGALVGMSPTERRRKEMEAARNNSKPASTPVATVHEVTMTSTSTDTYAMAKSPSISNNYHNHTPLATAPKTDGGASQHDMTMAQSELETLTAECESLTRQKKQLEASANSNASSELQSLLSKIQTIQRSSA